MAGMSDPRELFLHELGDVLYAEQTSGEGASQVPEEATDDELAQGFRSISKRRVST